MFTIDFQNPNKIFFILPATLSLITNYNHGSNRESAKHHKIFFTNLRLLCLMAQLKVANGIKCLIFYLKSTYVVYFHEILKIGEMTLLENDVLMNGTRPVQFRLCPHFHK